MSKKVTKEVQQAYNKLSTLPEQSTLKGVEKTNPYFVTRMEALGITEPNLYSFLTIRESSNSEKWLPIFTPTSTDDVKINYPALTGEQETYLENDVRQLFYRIRFNPNRNKEVRYIQPPNSGTHIFFPISILEKYKEAEKIDTLFLVEGEFKAQAGSMHGLDIVGLGGKDLFTDGENSLHQDILLLISRCEVQNIVLLLDADVFALNWDQEDEPDKNLAKRLHGFYRTVIRFRELAKGRVKDVYFSHVSERFLSEAKGLDDLLELKRGSENEVVTHAKKLTGSKAYFSVMNIAVETPGKILDYFGLKLVRAIPSAFYARHADEIKDAEFNFNGTRYQNVKDDGLKMVKHADSFKFIRVGCDYFKLIQVPNTNKKNVLDTKRVPWKSGEITRDFVHKGHKNFFDTIEKYDAFCNVPDNTGAHQAIVSNCFNLYGKVDHLPEDGTWPTIESYLKHVFGDALLPSGHTNYDLALDYLTLLYLHPTQKLPIVCLVNKKKNTGKSTFLWLLKELFQDNTTFIGNEELKDHLNDDWAGKLVVGIDEGFIDKKSVLERLKSMSTSNTIKLRGMYAGRQEIAFFGKFVLTSNDEDNFVMIDNDEVRFWVNKVPQLTKDDPDLLDKMINEIPAFLYYLQTRTILHQKTTRHWFDFKLLETEALKSVKNSSRSWLEMELRETVKDLFFEYHYHTLAYTIKELMAILNGDNTSVKFRKADVTKQLKERFGMVSKQGRYSFPQKPDKNTFQNATVEKHGRCFEFRVEDFLTPDEMKKEFSEFYTAEQIMDHRAAIVNDLGF